ncbi:tRNA pseudouridine(38-40) synthase [hydrothermal vent metagenome]|uniref:tRNA pseudouridine(38-40) synthase n=1 Tax=hydrothermal vent metagenome TaxID=652676 RepID=A0A3B1CRE6_9ZZZZ
MVLEYVGANYAGWQYQINALSIQEVVETALGKMLAMESRVTASGRTDAGVHAIYQPASVDVNTRMTDAEILKGLNSLLPKDIVVKELETAPPGFSVIRSAKEKTYRYTILNSPIRSAMDHGRVWWIINPLDLEAMTEGAKALLGEHDFTSFRSASCTAGNPVRSLKRLEIKAEGAKLYLEFTANGFLKQMVRNLVGTLVFVGLGKIKAVGVAEILEAKDRRMAGPCAPPEGLCLMDVVY